MPLTMVIAFWTLAIIVFGVVERLIDPDTFSSIWLGIWWATQTVTTVGYGDVVPQQTAGKVIAVFLMLGGLSFLAVLTGAITSAFVTRAQAESQDESAEDDDGATRGAELAARGDQGRPERRGEQGLAMDTIIFWAFTAAFNPTLAGGDNGDAAARSPEAAAARVSARGDHDQRHAAAW